MNRTQRVEEAEVEAVIARERQDRFQRVEVRPAPPRLLTGITLNGKPHWVVD